jgi:serine/threonine protein kinase
MVGSPEKINRVTFNELRGFRKTKDINELYSFGKKLGAGQFGTVFEGFNIKSETKCAIKVIEKKKAQKSQLHWDLMKDELSALQQLSHPYIVHTMDLLEDRDRIYVVQELMVDGNLMEALEYMADEGLPFTEKDAANLVKGLLRGLAYIHESKYIHRDIKLENVMVFKTQDVKGRTIFVPSYTDFGMSTRLQKGERVELAVGTPLYMAPEILAKLPYDSSADVWSLGVLIYILLTSEAPFDGNSPTQLLRNIQRE